MTKYNKKIGYPIDMTNQVKNSSDNLDNKKMDKTNVKNIENKETETKTEVKDMKVSNEKINRKKERDNKKEKDNYGKNSAIIEILDGLKSIYQNYNKK